MENTPVRYLFLITAYLFSVSPLLAQEKSAQNRVLAAAEHYVEANTLAVGYAELDAAWIEGFQKEIAQALGDEGREVAGHPGFGVARSLVAGMQAAGAREVMVVVGIGDIHLKGGVLLIITTTGGDAERSVQLLTNSLKEMATGKQAKDFVVRGDGNGNVLVGSKATVERYGNVTPAARPDLMTPLANKRSTDAALVVAPDADSRRVIRELWPELQPPFDKLTGPLLADDVKHLIVRATRPPEWSIEVELAARTDDAAAKLKDLAGAGYELAVKQIAVMHPDLTSVSRQAAKLLAVQQEGSSLTVRLDHDNHEAAQLVKQVLVPVVQSARERAFRNQRMNNMKQLALAMHNFHDTRKQFPASAAIVDEEGKPLLSWRVAILPYVEGGAMIHQFHLDEPWDSPHNIKLAKPTPDVYASPNHTELAAEGKTVYQLPVHAESVFPPATEVADPRKISMLGRELFIAPGTIFKEITDGTSNTVMIVQVAPEDAVVWTKPADWEVDLARAWQQLKGAGGKSTVAAYCDGSAHLWEHSEDRMEKDLPKIITRAGGEIIER